MATLVVGGEVCDYGSTQVELRRVPSGMLDHIHHTTTNSKHPSSPSSWNTKKAVVLGIIGLTTAVVSSATLFFSGIMDSSGPARTGESFLLNDRGPYSKCLPASGPWPDNSQDDDHNHGEDDNIHDDDDNPTSGSYVTCFSFEGGQDQCWSHSYKDGWGNWQPCKPKGYGTGWEFGTPTNDRMDKTHTCGTACTEFSQDDDDVPPDHYPRPKNLEEKY